MKPRQNFAIFVDLLSQLAPALLLQRIDWVELIDQYGLLDLGNQLQKIMNGTRLMMIAWLKYPCYKKSTYQIRNSNANFKTLFDYIILVLLPYLCYIIVYPE
jgi:hypothetical protein